MQGQEYDEEEREIDGRTKGERMEEMMREIDRYEEEIQENKDNMDKMRKRWEVDVEIV